MREQSITPSITVTIGRHTRIYFAFVTTALQVRSSHFRTAVALEK